MSKVIFSSIPMSVSLDEFDDIFEALKKAKKAFGSFNPMANPQRDGEFELLLIPSDKESQKPDYTFDDAIFDGFTPKDEDPMSAEEYENMINGIDGSDSYEDDEEAEPWHTVSSYNEWEETRFDSEGVLSVSIISELGTELKLEATGLDEEKLISAEIRLCTWNSLLDFLVEYRFISNNQANELKF